MAERDELPELPAEGLDFRRLAAGILRVEYDRRRIIACGWFAAFFFNESQRRRVIRDWPVLAECVGFAESVAISRPRPLPEKGPAEPAEIERALELVRSKGPAAFSESEFFAREDTPEFSPLAIRERVAECYSKHGVSIELGLEDLIDTIAAEFAFMQALIAERADDREQARFFFGHLMPLADKTAAAIRAHDRKGALDDVRAMLSRFLLTESALFRAGFDGEPASGRTLN